MARFIQALTSQVGDCNQAELPRGIAQVVAYRDEPSQLAGDTTTEAMAIVVEVLSAVLLLRRCRRARRPHCLAFPRPQQRPPPIFVMEAPGASK